MEKSGDSFEFRLTFGGKYRMGWRTKPEKRRDHQDQFENILGRTSLCRGDLSSDGAYRIDGWVEGSVESRAAVVIGESGAVRGNVRGTDVVVAGKIFGNVSCTGHLEIMATGKIEGDIDAKSVRIETGGVFRGMSQMGIEATDQANAEARVSEADDVPAYHCELSPAT
jgi:cytoskeletal protein CcmA (bactofilin family)